MVIQHTFKKGASARPEKETCPLKGVRVRTASDPGGIQRLVRLMLEATCRGRRVIDEKVILRAKDQETAA
jgi:hypothetical protein